VEIVSYIHVYGGEGIYIILVYWFFKLRYFILWWNPQKEQNFDEEIYLKVVIWEYRIKLYPREIRV
jgi:hypothetical protein